MPCRRRISLSMRPWGELGCSYRDVSGDVMGDGSIFRDGGVDRLRVIDPRTPEAGCRDRWRSLRSSAVLIKRVGLPALTAAR